LLEQELDVAARQFHSGPLGSDQQIGAKIAAGGSDGVIFLWRSCPPGRGLPACAARSSGGLVRRS